MHREVRQLVRELEQKPGITVEHSNNGHLKVRVNGAYRYSLPFSPRCPHSVKNSRADLKRMGLL